MHRLVCYQKRTYGSAYQLSAVENHGLVSPAAWKVTDGNERLVLQLQGPGKSFNTLRAFSAYDFGRSSNADRDDCEQRNQHRHCSLALALAAR